MSDVFKNVLIVIGVPPNRDGKPSNLMINRVRKAIQLNKKNNYSRIIFSGGPQHYLVPSSEIMRIMSLKFIPPHKIVVEKNSRDLLHNALFCWEIIKDHHPKTVTVLTSDWNLPRAKYIFRRAYKHMNVSLKFEACYDNVDFIEFSYLKIKEFLLLSKLKLFGIR